MLALTSEDWTGIVAVLGAIAIIIQNWRIHVVTKDTNVKAKEIDRAVNGKAAGATTMVSQVQDMHDDTFPLALTADEIDSAAVLPLLRRIATKLEDGE